MNGKQNINKGQSVQFLFTMILLFFLAISALFTILFGAKLYENIGNRMEENFTGNTALSYISNKVRQGDRAGQISVESIEGIEVLKIIEIYDSNVYNTIIYCKDGMLKELFYKPENGLTLNDGIDIMELEELNFKIKNNGLLQIESPGAKGDGNNSITLAIRSEVESYE